jgi:hypothetical protein
MVSVNGCDPERALRLVWRLTTRQLLISCERSKMVPLKEIKVLDVSEISLANSISSYTGITTVELHIGVSLR